MSSTATATFIFLAQQITIYLGVPIFIVGIIGHLLNVIIFLSLRTFRQNPCTFYLIVVSFANFGQLVTGLLSRIMINGFLIDWTQTSLIYCKFRLYFLIASALISNTSLSLAIADQYMVTASRPHWREFSRIRLAQQLGIAFILLWLCHGIPYLIYFNHIPTTVPSRVVCSTTNTMFNQYRTYFVGFVLAGFLPLVLTLIFAFLAYVNVRRLAYRTVPLVRRELEKQLTAMTLLHVTINFFGTFPYTITNVLVSTPSLTNHPTIGPVIQFTSTMATLLLYLNYASPFYLYTSVSNRFRRQLRHVLTNILFRPCQTHMENGRITPETN